GASVEGQGVAEGDDRVADDQRVGAADLDRRQPAGVDLDDGQVGGGVPTEDPGRELAAVGQGDGDGGGAVDDVVVRHDDAVGAEDEAAAGALLGHGLEVGPNGEGLGLDRHHRRAYGPHDLVDVALVREQRRPGGGDSLGVDRRGGARVGVAGHDASGHQGAGDGAHQHPGQETP